MKRDVLEYVDGNGRRAYVIRRPDGSVPGLRVWAVDQGYNVATARPVVEGEVLRVCGPKG